MKKFLFLFCLFLMSSVNSLADCLSSEVVWKDLCKDLKKDCPTGTFFAVIPEGDLWSSDKVILKTACIPCNSEEEIETWSSCGDSNEVINQKCPNRYTHLVPCGSTSVLTCPKGLVVDKKEHTCYESNYYSTFW